MLDVHLAGTAPAPRLDQRRHQDAVSWWLWYLLCAAASLAVGYFTLKSAEQFSLAVVVLVLALAVAIVRPVIGLYLVAFFAITGDSVTASWYPFTKNFSSTESILYVSDQLIISPLELFLGAMVLGWVIRMVAQRRWSIRRGPLLWPVLVFSGFMIAGLLYGLSRGGNSNAALWEFRSLMYVPIVFLLATNLLDRPAQYNRLLWCVMGAVFVNGIIAYVQLQQLDSLARMEIESFVAHGVTLPMNLMFVLIAAAWFFKSPSIAKRWVLPIMAVPVMIVYLFSERRSAFVGLIGAALLFAIILAWTNRKLFMRVVPITLVLFAGYTAAMWNNEGALGFPAQAVKSVVAPEQLSEKDQSSNAYRILETVDIVYTIRSARWTGLGFGHEFYKPVSLPGISSFLLADYMPHNSLLWIWIKAGIGGFVAMLYLFGTALRTGARSLLDLRTGDHAAITFTCAAFVLMYGVYTYVDIGWDAQNMVLLGIAFAQLTLAWSTVKEARAAAEAAATSEGEPEDELDRWPARPHLTAVHP
jgi:hypothetical protein